jgi:hypothetical protein
MIRFLPSNPCQRRNDDARRRTPPVVACVLLSVFLTALLAAGCGEDDSARSTDPPVPVAAPPSPDQGSNALPPNGQASGATPKIVKTGPFEREFEGIRFSVPAGWNEVENPTPEFVDARFQIPTPHGPVKLTFSSNAGGIDVNIERWVRQFELPPGKQPVVEDLSVDGARAKWVDLRGEFVGGAMAAGLASSGPMERMLGVAIPLGPRDMYLKLTGSNASVSDVRDAFRDFVRQARVSSGGSSGR